MSSLPTELLRSIVRTYRDKSVEDIVQVIEDFTRRRERAIQRRRDIESVRKKATDDIQELRGEVICGHEFTKFHGDPSGGSDSYEECLICGEEVREKPVRFT